MPVIGFLRTTSLADAAHLAAAFRQGLREIGFIDGQDVAIEYRYTENQADRLPALVADLISRRAALTSGQLFQASFNAGASALLIGSGPFFNSQRERLVALAASRAWGVRPN